MAGTADADDRLAVTRIVLRPIGTPLPLGLLGLAMATLAFSALQLHWIAPEQGRIVALAAVLFTAPLQAIASLYGFLARDPVAGTGMGVLAGSWATVGVVTLVSPPGSTSEGLGTILLIAAATILVPAAAGLTKVLASLVMGLTAARLAVTGIDEITGSSSWGTTAGVVGLVPGAVAMYAAAAFELEDAQHATQLPVLRRGAGRRALDGDVRHQLQGVAREAGVREEL